jgi:hypothetical protein
VTELPEGDRETRAAFAICLNAINFGSGWWPTIRKRPELSGYSTVAAGVVERFRGEGPWSAEELRRLDAAAIANTLGQDPEHPLMEQLAAELAQWRAFADVSTYAGRTVPFFKRAQLAAADLDRAGVASSRTATGSPPSPTT